MTYNILFIAWPGDFGDQSYADKLGQHPFENGVHIFLCYCIWPKNEVVCGQKKDGSGRKKI